LSSEFIWTFIVGCNYNSPSPYIGVKFPDKCGLENQPECDYAAKWTWRSGTDVVEFTVMSRFRDKWTGVGFASSEEKVRK